MVTCIGCGSEIPESEASCPQCGSELEGTSAPRGLWSSGPEEVGTPPDPTPSAVTPAGGEASSSSIRRVSPRHRTPPDITPLPTSALAVARDPDEEAVSATGTRPKLAPKPAPVLPLRPPEDEPARSDTLEALPEDASAEDAPHEGAAAPTEGVAPPMPPFLASRILAEDIEPTEPGARAIRLFAGFAGAVGAAGTLLLGGFTLGPILSALVLLCGVGLAVAPLDYARRALAIVGLAAVGVALSVYHQLAETDPFLGLLLSAGALVLSGGLLMRETYRAARLARVVVLVGVVATGLWFVLSGGFESLTYFEPAWQSWAPAIPKVLLGITLVLSLLAFMDSSSTAGARVWASFVLVFYLAIVAVQLGIRFYPLGRGVGASVPDPVAGHTVAAATLIALGAVGLSQVLVVAHRRTKRG